MKGFRRDVEELPMPTSVTQRRCKYNVQCKSMGGGPEYTVIIMLGY